MSHSFAHLLYHIVFATKNRRACLDDAVREQLYPVLGNLIKEEGGIPLEINGMPDHIHILARLKQDKAVSAVLRAIKANSAGWIHKTFPELISMSWQTGYGAFTVSLSQAEVVRRYIKNQQKHHARQTYIDELRELLHAHGLEVSEEDLLAEEE